MKTTVHPRISKRGFISKVAGRSGQPIRVVSEVYESLIAELTDAVRRGDTVVLTGALSAMSPPVGGVCEAVRDLERCMISGTRFGRLLRRALSQRSTRLRYTRLR